MQNAFARHSGCMATNHTSPQSQNTERHGANRHPSQHDASLDISKYLSWTRASPPRAVGRAARSGNLENGPTPGAGRCRRPPLMTRRRVMAEYLPESSRCRRRPCLYIDRVTTRVRLAVHMAHSLLMPW